jgi:hypothetical protein
MALSYGFKQALKNRTRRSRRIRVLTFLVTVGAGLSYAGRPWSWGQLPIQALLYLSAFTAVYRDWKWSQHLPVSSLDDRAMLEYGMEFEQLGKKEQKTILRHYRVGTYFLDYFPDERQREVERDAHVRAYEILRLLFPGLLLVYLAGWKLLPEGRLRAGWTDGPVVFVWVGLLVLALPQIFQLWDEPDEIGDTGIVHLGD